MIESICYRKGMPRMAIKSFTVACVLTLMTLLTGCQAFQFFDSPIPVNATADQVSVDLINHK